MEIKIGICIPFRSKVTLGWASTIANIIASTPYPMEIVLSKHYGIDLARNDLVMSAKNRNCTHILFLDTDILPHMYINKTFTPFFTFINHLLEFDYPIISGIYYSKIGNLAIYQYTHDENKPFDFVKETFEDYAEKVRYVDGVPMGLCFINMKIFDELKDKGYFPWFEYKVEYEKKRMISEDLNFCLKLLKVFGEKYIMVWGHLVGLHETSMLLYPDGKTTYHVFGEY